VILSDGLRPLRWKPRAASTRATKKVRAVWGKETWAVTVRDTLFGADIPSVGSQPRNTAVSCSLTIMKAVAAAFVALFILWVVDVNLNGGRYTYVVMQMIRSAASSIGIGN